MICSGPRRGNQFTYALLERRAPAGKVLEREDALRELARRYFSSHGPATLRDFAWWSGLAAKDAQRGIESSGLQQQLVDGRAMWTAGPNPARLPRKAPLLLLPNYDEYLIAYKDRAPVVDPSRAANIVARSHGAFPHFLIVDGRLAGSWRRTTSPTSVLIEVAPFKKLTAVQQRAVASAADAYGEFMGMPATARVV